MTDGKGQDENATNKYVIPSSHGLEHNTEIIPSETWLHQAGREIPLVRVCVCTCVWMSQYYALDLTAVCSEIISTYSHCVTISGVKRSHWSVHDWVTLNMESFWWFISGFFLPVWQTGCTYGTFTIKSLVTVGRVEKKCWLHPHKDRNNTRLLRTATDVI